MVNNKTFIIKGQLAGGEVISVDEGNGIGYVIKDRNDYNYGNVGLNAKDFSFSNITSNTLGATGELSFASNQNTTASGKGSHAEGNNTFARAVGEHSGGVFGTDYTPVSGSTISSPTDRLFNCGNGVDNNNRTDAFTIYKNGAVRFYRNELSDITNINKEGLFIYNSSKNNKPTIHNGSEWKELAYEENKDNYIITYSASSELLLNETNRTVIIDSSLFPVTIILPDVTQFINKEYILIGYDDTNIITINTTNNQEIRLSVNNVSTSDNLIEGDILKLVSTGTYWQITS